MGPLLLLTCFVLAFLPSSWTLHQRMHPVRRKRLWATKTTPTSLSQLNDDGSSAPAAVVYDNVIAREASAWLGSHVAAHESLTGFAVFDRSALNLGPVEAMMDSILTAMNDDSRWVEFWWGRRWISHCLHRDVDEQLLATTGRTVHPRHGHVLYLSAAPEVTGGQTVVLDGTEGASRLYIVPPRPSRLLRFDGSLLHGVPRPALEYFLNDADLGEVVQLVQPDLRGAACVQELVHAEGDLTDAESHIPFSRVNLLFNTWPEAPPFNSTSSSSDNGGRGGTSTTVSIRAGDGVPDLSCTLPSPSPARVPFVGNEDDDEKAVSAADALTLRLKLPDDRRRRDSYDKTLAVLASPSAVNAFVIRQQDDRPRSIVVHSNDDDD